MMPKDSALPEDPPGGGGLLGDTILLVTDTSAESVESALRRAPERRMQVLVFNGNGAVADEAIALPDRCEPLRLREPLDFAELRHEFLRFLDEWPHRKVLAQRSFNELFHHPDGSSVWWTGPGIERNPDAGIFPKLKLLWTFDRVIKADKPAQVFIYARSADVATLLVSRCERERLTFEVLDGSAHPRPSPWNGRWAWLLVSLYRLTVYPVKVSVRSIVARLVAPTATDPRVGTADPAIVCTSQFSRCVTATGGTFVVSFWQALCDTITSVAPGTKCFHLVRFPRQFPGYRQVSFFYHTAWALLRKIDHAVPAKECHPALGSWLQSLPGQLLALWRYCRLEAQQDFRASLCFAGADVSWLYVTGLRRAVAGISEWAQTVGAITKSLPAVGNVRAMLVYEEMYRPGMLNIAAARALGIPTIGVQHGTINPNHLMYMLPRGQTDNAPIPDYFAVYSEYVKEIMTTCGAYPEDRMWVTGSPRFDELVTQPVAQHGARERLGLPDGKKVVLVTTQTFAWFRAAVKAVFEAAKERNDVIICVKVHPKTLALSSSAYRALAQQVGATNVLCFDDHFDDLLAACDVLISASSTTILEATLVGRRTICVNFSDEPDRYPYVEDGASVPARSTAEMVHALEVVLSPQLGMHLEAERLRFLRRHAGESERGGAAMALTRRILDLTCPAAGHRTVRTAKSSVGDRVSAWFSA